jgi:F420-dependent oxidoreductase-like protein
MSTDAAGIPRIGLSLGYWPWFTYEQQLAMAVLADDLGLDSVWASEAWGQDVVSMLGALSVATEHVRLGTAIMQIPARPATSAAMAIASLDVMSGGRLCVGIGPSGPQVSEGWYGAPFGKPLKRTREYVALLRSALAGDTVPVQADPDADGVTGLGKPLRLLVRTERPRVPIYMGATAPGGIKQCAAIGDGWIGFLVDPETPGPLLTPLHEALAEAGRDRDEFEVCCIVPTAVCDTLEEARAAVRPWIAFYLGAMGAKGKNFYVELADAYGYGDAAAAVQDRWLEGDRAAAEEALPHDFVDAVTIAATPSSVRGRLEQFAAGGIDTVLCTPCGDAATTIRGVAAARG